MAGRHHGDALHLQCELGIVGHGRERQADVVDLAAAGQQAGHQCLLYRSGVPAVVVADDDAFGHASLGKQFRHAEANGIEAHKVDFLGKQPARIVFAEAGRLDQRQTFEVGGVGFQVSARSWQHVGSSL